jgi:hypothetical protein
MKIPVKENGTYVPEDSFAVVWGPEGWSMLLPKEMRHNKNYLVPTEAQGLIACGLRLPTDVEFFSEAVDWMLERIGGQGTEH